MSVGSATPTARMNVREILGIPYRENPKGEENMKIGWLATGNDENNEFVKVEVLEQLPHMRKLKVLEGDSQGQEIVLGGERTPYKEFYPALFIQDNKPVVFRKDLRSIQMVDIGQFPDQKQAKKLIPLQEAYSFRDWTATIIDGVNNCDHQLVIGPKGCGKTSAIVQLAARIGQPVLRINFTAQVAISDLVGSVGFGKRNDGSIGTIWNDGPLPIAMKNGYWLLLDEIDYGDPSVLSLLYPVLEEFNPSKGKFPRLTLKEKDGEIIEAHPNFRIFATGNSIGGDANGEYVGTSAMNPALVDRFSGHGQVLRVPQVQVREEREILRSVIPNMSNNFINKAAQFAAKMRGEYIKNFSTRVLINFCQKMLILKNTVEAARVTFVPLVEDDPTRKAVEAAVQSTFGKSCRIAGFGGDGAVDTGNPVEGGIEITPEKAKAIFDAHSAGMSYETLEREFGLPSSGGKCAWRIVKSYKKENGIEKTETPAASSSESPVLPRKRGRPRKIVATPAPSESSEPTEEAASEDEPVESPASTVD